MEDHNVPLHVTSILPNNIKEGDRILVAELCNSPSTYRFYCFSVKGWVSSSVLELTHKLNKRFYFGEPPNPNLKFWKVEKSFPYLWYVTFPEGIVANLGL